MADRSELWAVLSSALDLVQAVLGHANTLPTELTPAIAARPLMLAEPLHARLVKAITDLRRAPYVNGERTVTVLEQRIYGSLEWTIWPSDDWDNGRLVDEIFQSRPEAEAYVAAHGMALEPKAEGAIA